MAQRGITEAQLEFALAHRIPGRNSPGQAGSIWVYGHVPGGGILKVCVSTSDQDFVITVAWGT
jgi:hypothetical protein